MSEGDSVSRWLDGVRVGDGDDIRRLWDRYFEKLVRLAGSRLPVHARRAFDEEDVALSAFHSFCEAVGRGQFARLADRDGLWRLLATITTRKAIGFVRRQSRRKRGGCRVLGESALDDGGGATTEGLVRFLGREPTPEAAAQLADTCDRLFDKLEDPMLRSVASRRLDGRSREEIAAELGVTTRTVDRKLRLIRALWEQEVVE